MIDFGVTNMIYNLNLLCFIIQNIFGLRTICLDSILSTLKSPIILVGQNCRVFVICSFKISTNILTAVEREQYMDMTCIVFLVVELKVILINCKPLYVFIEYESNFMGYSYNLNFLCPSKATLFLSLSLSPALLLILPLN